MEGKRRASFKKTKHTAAPAQFCSIARHIRHLAEASRSMTSSASHTFHSFLKGMTHRLKRSTLKQSSDTHCAPKYALRWFGRKVVIPVGAFGIHHPCGLVCGVPSSFARSAWDVWRSHETRAGHDFHHGFTNVAETGQRKQGAHQRRRL